MAGLGAGIIVAVLAGNTLKKFLISPAEAVPLDQNCNLPTTLISNWDNGGQPAPILPVMLNNSENLVPKNYRIFADLGISGSAQFSRSNLHTLLKSIYAVSERAQNHGVMVFDLRQETHGFLGDDGMAVSWFADRDWGNRCLAQDVEALWKRYIHQFNIAQDVQATVYNAVIGDADQVIHSKTPLRHITTSGIHAENIEIEYYNHHQSNGDFFNQANNLNNVGHLWLPLTDHLPPPPSILRQMQKWLRAKYDNNCLPHIHVHCRAGDGRTTTILACLEMIIRSLTGQIISFDNILLNQAQGGGLNLLSKPADWKGEYFEQRQKVIQDFYNSLLNQRDRYY